MLDQGEIRRLNDAVRTRGQGGRVLMTAASRHSGPERVSAILAGVAASTPSNPIALPMASATALACTVAASEVIWKIDYYDSRPDASLYEPG